MRILTRFLGVVIAIGIAFSSVAQAALIRFASTNLGGGQYQYDYTVTNNSLSAIDEFTIFFDPTLYANLTSASAPAGWDPLVIQPDLILGDGFFDALALGSGIAAGTSLSGFSVIFSFLGIGAPGAQAFDIVDPLTFATLSSGVTSAIPSGVVPLPGAGILMLSGLFAAGFGSWRRSKKPAPGPL